MENISKILSLLLLKSNTSIQTEQHLKNNAFKENCCPSGNITENYMKMKMEDEMFSLEIKIIDSPEMNITMT